VAETASDAIVAISVALEQRQFPAAAIAAIGASRDVRLLWLLQDLLPFFRSSGRRQIEAAFLQLSGIPLAGVAPADLGNWLIAWDLPAPPAYREFKRDLFLLIEPRWAPFFDDDDDDDSAIDWRWVGWGGVFIDDRRDATGPGGCPRGCIPALDDPAVTAAAAGDWYADDGLVFGVTVGTAARAYPKHIMEVHEMVNDTLGGRRIGMPYCTLCRSAQAYFTDNVAGFAPVLRTSGLLSRSNKFMYDLSTWSAVDTFTGEAISGPLHKAGVTLQQVSVVTSTWGEWRAAYPHTTIVARDGGIGRSYPRDPLGGRDDQGPIFPVGDVDPRLRVQDLVVGVLAGDGTPVAFPVGAVRLALEAGEAVELAGGRVVRDAGGLRAIAGDQQEVVTHEAFWFAWSQFYPGTLLWPPLDGT
jgi:hypothetical protein